MNLNTQYYIRKVVKAGYIPCASLDFSNVSLQGSRKIGLPVYTQEGPRSLTTEEWLDSVEAAVYLKVSLGALRNMTSNGQVPFYKMGNRNRYRIEELRQLLLSQKRGASNGN